MRPPSAGGGGRQAGGGGGHQPAGGGRGGAPNNPRRASAVPPSSDCGSGGAPRQQAPPGPGAAPPPGLPDQALPEGQRLQAAARLGLHGCSARSPGKEARGREAGGASEPGRPRGPSLKGCRLWAGGGGGAKLPRGARLAWPGLRAAGGRLPLPSPAEPALYGCQRRARGGGWGGCSLPASASGFRSPVVRLPPRSAK